MVCTFKGTQYRYLTQQADKVSRCDPRSRKINVYDLQAAVEVIRTQPYQDYIGHLWEQCFRHDSRSCGQEVFILALNYSFLIEYCGYIIKLTIIFSFITALTLIVCSRLVPFKIFLANTMTLSTAPLWKTKLVQFQQTFGKAMIQKKFVNTVLH